MIAKLWIDYHFHNPLSKWYSINCTTFFFNLLKISGFYPKGLFLFSQRFLGLDFFNSLDNLKIGEIMFKIYNVSYQCEFFLNYV